MQISCILNNLLNRDEPASPCRDPAPNRSSLKTNFAVTFLAVKRTVFLGLGTTGWAWCLVQLGPWAFLPSRQKAPLRHWYTHVQRWLELKVYTQPDIAHWDGMSSCAWIKVDFFLSWHPRPLAQQVTKRQKNLPSWCWLSSSVLSSLWYSGFGMGWWSASVWPALVVSGWEKATHQLSSPRHPPLGQLSMSCSQYSPFASFLGLSTVCLNTMRMGVPFSNSGPFSSSFLRGFPALKVSMLASHPIKPLLHLSGTSTLPLGKSPPPLGTPKHSPSWMCTIPPNSFPQHFWGSPPGFWTFRQSPHQGMVISHCPANQGQTSKWQRKVTNF